MFLLMLQSSTDALHAEYVIAIKLDGCHKRALANWTEEVLVERLDVLQLPEIKEKVRGGRCGP